MAKGQLIAAMEFSNVAEDEFNDWYDLEHIPERRRVPGFLVCQRWIGAENPKQSVATYDLESLAVLKGDAYCAIGGENLSPWSRRITGRCQRLLRFEGDQILPGDTTAPSNAGGLLLVGMTPAPAVETEFNAWYDTEHIPAAHPAAHHRPLADRLPQLSPAGLSEGRPLFLAVPAKAQGCPGKVQEQCLR
jgi:hypothetical protein